MNDVTSKIQDIAAKLFQEGKVDLFLAWEKGEFDFQSQPYFAHNADEVKNIVFDEYCIHNLSNSLLQFRDGDEKIGIVVKGCDSRGIVRLLQDHQFTRERLYIVGVGCTGMKDPLQAMRAASGLGEGSAAAADAAAKCHDCIQPTPVLYDELVGSEQPPRIQPAERFAAVKEFEAKSADERYQFFEDTLGRCIRCYACRQGCVACNCRTCIYDEMKPQWVGREHTVADNFMFHLVKAYHMAGRCTECGECERVCPMHIPLMLINQKMIKDINELYGPYDAGIGVEENSKPPLSSYTAGDPDDFI